MNNEENNILNNNNDNNSINTQTEVNSSNTPVQEQATSINEFSNNEPVSKNIVEPVTINNNVNLGNQSNKKKFPIVILIIVIIVILGLLFLGYKLLSKGSSTSESDNSGSTSFFIKNNTGKYALFNEDGKKLSDFIYDDYENFYNGTTVVEKDNNYAIINEKGKIVLDYGKYATIKRVSGIYRAETKDYKYHVLDSNGKLLYENVKYNIDSYGDKYTFSVINTNDKYIVLNSVGKEIISIPVSGSESMEGEDNNDRYFTLFYNNKNYVIDAKEGKMLVSFDEKKHYCVNTDDIDGKYITMNSCVSWYEKSDNPSWKVIKDGKVYDLTDKCESVTSIDGIMYCYTDDKSYVLNSDLNLGIEVDNNYKNTTIIDEENYIEEDYNSNPRKVLFYNKGKKVNEVSCVKIEKDSFITDSIYTLRTITGTNCEKESGLYEFYDKKGNKLGKSYKEIPYDYNSFDDNKLSIVSEDGNNYYLINEKVEKVSEDFDKIYQDSDTKYYNARKNNQEGILDRTGKKVIDTIYKDAVLYEVINYYVAVLCTKDNSYIVYNLNSNKEILKTSEKPDIYNNYIITKDNGKNNYYTFKGKLLFSE